MPKIRLNRGGLYPTDKPKRAGYKDTVYDYICSGCGKKILKKDSNMTISGKRYHWGCKPEGK